MVPATKFGEDARLPSFGGWHEWHPTTPGRGVFTAEGQHRYHLELAWTPRLGHRRIELFDARHAGITAGFRSAEWSGYRVRLSSGTSDDALSCRHWDADANRHGAVANARSVASPPDARRPIRGRYSARRPGILLVRPSGDAAADWDSRRVPGAPEADRELSQGTGMRDRTRALPSGSPKVPLDSLAWTLRSDRRVPQALRTAAMDVGGCHSAIRASHQIWRR